MSGVHAAALLGSFLTDQRDRVLRRALRVLEEEADDDRSLGSAGGMISDWLAELEGLLLERGHEAPRLFGEAVRHSGGKAFEAGAEPSHLVWRFKSLELAIHSEWGRRVGDLPTEVASLLSECIQDGLASAMSDYVRLLRCDRVEFRESALIETILEHLDEGIMVTEADGTVSFATRPAIALLGPALERAIGGNISGRAFTELLASLQARGVDGRPLTPDDLTVTRVLETGRSQGAVLMRIRRDGDTEQVLEVNALPIWEEGAAAEPYDPETGVELESRPRTIRGVISTLRDRTSELRKSEELGAAYSELKDLHGRLLHRSRAQAMGELAAGASHALNNLLNAMHLRLQLLEQQPGPEQIAALRRSVNDIATLVSRLQQFSGKRVAGRTEPTDLDQVVQETLELVRPDMSRTREALGPTRVVQRLASPHQVRANPSELREALAALLLHAREQIAEGSPLSVKTGPAAGREGVECRLRFLPAGGRTPVAEQVIEPFTESAAPLSLDLVLASTRQSLSRWGGTVEARSLTTGDLEITLTLVAAEDEEIAVEPESHDTVSRQVRVLVIDDDPDNAEMLAQVLSSEGHHVLTASTGKEALERWKSSAYDVALVDLVMPDMTGLEISQALLESRPQARVALVTGWELDEEQRRTAPVHAVFRKPVDLRALLAFISPQHEEHAPAGP